VIFKEMSVGLVAINVQQPLTIAAAAAGVAPTMCTHPRCQRLAATIVEEELELAATFVEEVLELVAPFLPINRQQESRANGERGLKRTRERYVRRERRSSCQGQQPCCLEQQCARELGVEFE
jgi:Tat protein secretion system quality control protein TatD with DNase activity